MRWMQRVSRSVLTHTGGAVFADCGLSCNHIHTARISRRLRAYMHLVCISIIARHAGSLSHAAERYLWRRHVGHRPRNYRALIHRAADLVQMRRGGQLRGHFICMRVMLVAKFHLRVCAWWLRNRFGPCEVYMYYCNLAAPNSFCAENVMPIARGWFLRLSR
jgi:hypothetical protein